ncbi:MAG: histidine triad nucleotide-binding protein [Deltaproteobacteria bacterium]|nr:histidine triad nucleotide-binding protein [Deltaproteobacteria bacterium]
MPTVFERIVAREIPAAIVHEDEWIVAFRDIEPQAPFHVLVVPRTPIPRLRDAGPEEAGILGRMLLVARKVATEAGYDDVGFRCVLNDGPDAGQVVPHLHLHVLAGRGFGWPPG